MPTSCTVTTGGAGLPRQLEDIADTALRCQLGALTIAQCPDHHAHLGEGTRSLLLDDPQRVDGSLGVGGGNVAAGLGAHGDRRHVMRHGVVQVARELLPLTQLDLLLLLRVRPRL